MGTMCTATGVATVLNTLLQEWRIQHNETGWANSRTVHINFCNFLKLCCYDIKAIGKIPAYPIQVQLRHIYRCSKYAKHRQSNTVAIIAKSQQRRANNCFVRMKVTQSIKVGQELVNSSSANDYHASANVSKKKIDVKIHQSRDGKLYEIMS